VNEVEYLVKNHGVKIVGENRVQQLLERYDALKEMGVEIHFIGALQTNKVKYIIDKVNMIHSVDRISLAREIDRQAEKCGIVMDVLVEVNSAREKSKAGVDPSCVLDFCREIASFEHIKVRGFMTMAPKCENSDEYRKYFKETYRQCLDIWQKKLDNIYSAESMPRDEHPVLSMGMSGSFEAAIAEGATIVRIGGALFRDTAPPAAANQ
jgi:pyridoxal phosphate enzyme (YggS family)